MWGTPTDANTRKVRKASPSEAAIGIVMLAGSVVLFPTIGTWPESLFAFAKNVALSLSIICMVWSAKTRQTRWLIAATCGVLIFNPIWDIIEDKSWDILGLIFSVSLFVFGYRLIDARISRYSSYLFTIIGTTLLILTYYVNHYMPHGSMHLTGDIVCMNDGRGPCGEERVEDLSKIDIPDWAKFLRSNLIWTMLFFGVSAILLANKPVELETPDKGLDQ